MKQEFWPEGRLLSTSENQALLSSPAGLRQAMEENLILEAMVTRCDPEHNLKLACGPLEGFMPRQETALGVEEGLTREIAILSRVGRPACFVVTGLRQEGDRLIPLLSRRRAQEMALTQLMQLRPGAVIPAAVTHLESFGAFVDVGCGLPSMIGVEHISVSRIPHPVYRFTMGQQLLVLVTQVDSQAGRLQLSHRELLGTWAENAALFAQGETVAGYVRGIKEYGIFVELTPNLSGLAEPKAGLKEGDRVSVYIKSITPERMKIKLLVIDQLPSSAAPELIHYFHTAPRLERWRYAPEGCPKGVEWDAQATPPSP